MNFKKRKSKQKNGLECRIHLFWSFPIYFSKKFIKSYASLCLSLLRKGITHQTNRMKIREREQMSFFLNVSFRGIVRLERISLLTYRSTLINTLIKNRATAKYKLTSIIIYLCISWRIDEFLRFSKRNHNSNFKT